MIQYNTIQYITCNAPYVTKMLFVGAVRGCGFGSPFPSRPPLESGTLFLWNLWNFRRYISPYVASVEGSKPLRASAPVCLFLVSASILALEQCHKLRSRTSYNRYAWRKASHMSKESQLTVLMSGSCSLTAAVLLHMESDDVQRWQKLPSRLDRCLHSPLSEWITEWPTEWMCELRCRSSHQHIHIFTRTRKPEGQVFPTSSEWLEGHVTTRCASKDVTWQSSVTWRHHEVVKY